MKTPKFQSVTDQVISYLRKELIHGRWQGEMPGQFELEKLLGVSRKTVELALNALEKDGVLVAQGVGKRRKINIPDQDVKPAQMRVAVLTYAPEDHSEELVIQLRSQLGKAGHDPIAPEKSLV